MDDIDITERLEHEDLFSLGTDHEYQLEVAGRAANEIRHLRAEIAEKDKRIARAINLLDRALGDTDPDIEPDEHEDPVYWAMRVLTGGSADADNLTWDPITEENSRVDVVLTDEGVFWVPKEDET